MIRLVNDHAGITRQPDQISNEPDLRVFSECQFGPLQGGEQNKCAITLSLFSEKRVLWIDSSGKEVKMDEPIMQELRQLEVETFEVEDLAETEQIAGSLSTSTTSSTTSCTSCGS